MECQFCGKPVNPEKNQKIGEHDACYKAVEKRESNGTLCAICGDTMPKENDYCHDKCDGAEWYTNLPETE